MASENEPLIVLGDLLDSAIAVTSTGNILKMGNLAELKSHNLDNLLQCRNNPNIHVMFGNRDLNKLKVLPLAKVKAPFAKPSSHESIRTFLNPLTEDISYLKLAKQLQSNINNKNWEWEIPDLKKWYPFWKPYTANTSQFTLWKNGRHSSPEQVMTCLERFFLIFGADNANGTMSAHNSLYCIPNEVLGNEFATVFPKFADQVSASTNINLGNYSELLNECGKTEYSGLKNELDLAAALVLTVYMRMFYPKHASSNKYIARNKTLKYDGLLYDFYISSQTYFCAYANTDARLLTFSHGGITKNFLDSDYTKKYNDFLNDDSTYKLMTELSGGYYRKVDGGQSKSVIETGISTFNKNCKSILVKVIHNYLYSKNYAKFDTNTNNWAWNKIKKSTPEQYNKYIKPSKDLVKFIAMTSSFDSCQHKKDCDQSTKLEVIDYSPIMPDILGLRKEKNTLFCSDSDLVQFIGHVPQGFGATIDLFTSNNTSNTHKTYNINLDISNTALSHNTIDNLDKLSDNYFYMVYGSDNTLKTHGKIHVNELFKHNNNLIKKAGMTNYVIEYAPDYDVLGIEFKSMIQFNSKTQEGKEVKDGKDFPFDYFEHGKLDTGNLLYTHKTQSGFVYTPVLTSLISRGGNRKTTRKLLTKQNRRIKRTHTKKLKRK